ncbi:hypothetical protein GQ457_05G019970 [Hibiscus cannabinus]
MALTFTIGGRCWNSFSQQKEYLKLLKSYGELVTLKQISSVDQYYADFNLKCDIGQYIRVFQPRYLMIAFRLAVHFEQIFTIFFESASSFSRAVSYASTIKSTWGTVSPPFGAKISLPSSSRAPSPKKGVRTTNNGPRKLSSSKIEEKECKGFCY